jgi:hypothetical protein
MNILEKIQKLNDFWKKILMFGILFIVAALISIFIVNNFKETIRQSNESGFTQAVNLSGIGEEISESIDEFHALKLGSGQGPMNNTTTTPATTTTATTSINNYSNGGETKETTK